MIEITETGVKLARDFTDELNHICKTEGGIQRDDARIWNILHEMDNELWDELLSTLEQVVLDDPSCAKPQDQQVLTQARLDLNRSIRSDRDFVGIPKVASSGNKRTVWQVTMTMREILNRYQGIHVPNKPSDGGPKPPPTNFNDLFGPKV